MPLHLVSSPFVQVATFCSAIGLSLPSEAMCPGPLLAELVTFPRQSRETAEVSSHIKMLGDDGTGHTCTDDHSGRDIIDVDTNGDALSQPDPFEGRRDCSE